MSIATIPASPRELGLPQAAWRPVQLYALHALVECTEPVVMLQAPPGTGKSLLAAAWAAMQGKVLTYTCVTKDLQAQFIRSFPEVSAEVRGRDNYPTLNAPELWTPGEAGHVSCEDCTRRKTRSGYACSWCRDTELCPYRVAKDAAAAAPVGVLNLAYWLREANSFHPSFSYSGGTREAVCWRCKQAVSSEENGVCEACGWIRCPCGACAEDCEGGPLRVERYVCVDEADELPAVLRGYIAVGVPRYWMGRLGIPEPKFQTANAEHQAAEWHPWLEYAAGLLGQEADQARDQAIGLALRPRTTRLRTARRLGEMAEALLRVRLDMAEDPSSWVRGSGQQYAGKDETGERRPGVEFLPVSVARHTQHLVWRHARRCLLMSATLLSKETQCEQLGLDPARVGWVDLPSTFPVANRPVFFLPRAAVSFANRERTWPEITRGIDAVLDAYPERCLVHTHSYGLMDYVVANSRHVRRMLWYRRAAEREGVLQAMRLSPGAVLVAPSMERGVSLDEDLCRCVIVAKMPAADLSDPVVSALFHRPDGWLWYRIETARRLVQSLGRGVRSETDWCDSWVLDGEFARLWSTRHLLPGWFVEGVVTDTGTAVRRLHRLT